MSEHNNQLDFNNNSIPQNIAIEMPSSFHYNNTIEVFNMKERLAKLEVSVEHIQSDIHEIKSEINTVRWWILGAVISIIVGLGCIMIAFGQYQATWFQKSLDRNWEISQKALDKIESTQLQLLHKD